MERAGTRGREVAEEALRSTETRGDRGYHSVILEEWKGSRRHYCTLGKGLIFTLRHLLINSKKRVFINFKEEKKKCNSNIWCVTIAMRPIFRCYGITLRIV